MMRAAQTADRTILLKLLEQNNNTTRRDSLPPVDEMNNYFPISSVDSFNSFEEKL